MKKVSLRVFINFAILVCGPAMALSYPQHTTYNCVTGQVRADVFQLELTLLNSSHRGSTFLAEKGENMQVEVHGVTWQYSPRTVSDFTGSDADTYLQKSGNVDCAECNGNSELPTSIIGVQILQMANSSETSIPSVLRVSLPWTNDAPGEENTPWPRVDSYCVLAKALK